MEGKDWKRSLSGEYSFFQQGLVRAIMAAFGNDLRQANEWLRIRIARKRSIGQIYEELEDAVRPRRIVDKSPLYALDPATLRRMETLFQKPKYVHLVREPRAVIRSFQRAHIEQIWLHERRFSSITPRAHARVGSISVSSAGNARHGISIVSSMAPVHCGVAQSLTWG